MGTTKLLLLHGNPGRPDYFSGLVSLLNCEEEDLLLPELMQHPDPVKELLDYLNRRLDGEARELIIIAYSWGAYLATKLLEEAAFTRKIRISQLIFISPFMCDNKRIPVAARLLMRLPVVNKMIAGKIAAGRYRDFSGDILGNHFVWEQLGSELYSFLLHPLTWLRAFRLKVFQEDHPVIGECRVPVWAYYAKDDKVMDLPFQLVQLRSSYHNPGVEFFETGGHGLIWTRMSAIAGRINTSFKNTYHETTGH
jgi:pimeloyl-ACP methyl ester carboxylesterase